jgi:hypothetical protein
LPSLTKVWDFFLYCPLPPRHFEPFSKYHPYGHELYNRKQKESITGKIPPRPSCCWDIEGSETRELQDVYFIRAFQDGNYVELSRLSAPSEESSNKLSIRTTTYSPVDKTYELISPEEWLKEICIHLTGYSRENQRKTEAHQEICWRSFRRSFRRSSGGVGRSFQSPFSINSGHRPLHSISISFIIIITVSGYEPGDVPTAFQAFCAQPAFYQQHTINNNDERQSYQTTLVAQVRVSDLQSQRLAHMATHGKSFLHSTRPLQDC